MVKQLAQSHWKLLASPLHSLFMIFGQIFQFTHPLFTQAKEIWGHSSLYYISVLVTHLVLQRPFPHASASLAVWMLEI